MAKTIRFTELVNRSGRPKVATLWTAPADDPEFSKAIDQNRVLTVSQQPTGSRKDVAWIGFKQEPNVSYFIFPRKLPESDSRMVVGIKYDLVEQPEVIDPVTDSRQKASKRGVKATAPEKKEPTKKTFTVVFKRTATWESTVQITARNKAEARKNAASPIAEQELPMSEAVVHNDIRAVEKG